MNKEQKEVMEFMMMAGQEMPIKPTIPLLEVRVLRVKLIAEELMELCSALSIQLKVDTNTDSCSVIALNGSPDLVLAADACADLKVVTIGTEVALGVDGQPIWDEVHRSNMSKFIDGHRREDGKWIKGPSYSPANIELIIQQQSNK